MNMQIAEVQPLFCKKHCYFRVTDYNPDILIANGYLFIYTYLYHL